MSRDTRAVISTDALRHNLEVARQHADGGRVMAVIKANGYGHGLLRVAGALRQADAFAVTCMEEAIPLREAGYAHPILLLEGVFEPAELKQACRYRLDIAVHSEWQLRLLEDTRLPRPLSVWLKIDSGMHRLGFQPDAVAAIHQRLLDCAWIGPHVRFMTHLACADDRHDERTRLQVGNFDAVTRDLAGEHSIANSAGVLGWPEARRDWLRPGVMLYGVNPFIDGMEAPALRPAMTLKSRLIAINQYKAGDSVGYGATWTCPEDMPVGVVAIGYGDGYPRHAVSGTPVLVNDRETQLVGRVSMDMLSVDLRGLEQEVDIGDEVTLWGQGLPVERVAEKAGTIAYELLCGVTSRVHVQLGRDSLRGENPQPV
ncbi:alanine racemase [Natronocella acetinitrilica]|uniref:Alanine racemase n=1 Tax=Natronocella acetinitrilica TaxID=414046 RepID=A0AAE3G719_9GAMM|nr:alanine racemase [Natronocella acetinitrilica]